MARTKLTPVQFNNPYKFYVYRNAANTSTNAYAKVAHDTTVFDTGSNMTTNNKFTAPVAGFYWFCATGGNTVAGATPIFSALYKNSSQALVGGGANTAPNGGWNTVTGILQLAAGDFVEHYFIGGNGSAMEVGITRCYFQGFLLSTT